MLSRRIQLPPITPPAPALSGIPPHLQRSSVPPRVQSPHGVRPQSPHPPSRPASPSPFRVRNVGVRPESPSISSVTSPAGQQPPFHPQRGATDVRSSLCIRHIPEQGVIKIHSPFKVGYKITLSSSTGTGKGLEDMILQHLERPPTASSVVSWNGNHATGAEDRYRNGNLSTAPTSLSGMGSPSWADLSVPRSNTNSPDVIAGSSTTSHRVSEESKRGSILSVKTTFNSIPLPFLDRETLKHNGVMYLGSSIITPREETEEGNVTVWLFELEFVALREGFQSLAGGLRLLQGTRTIQEWDALGEVWV
jgi:hypothetical protein